VVIANPNGITCDGCGFINTPMVTLSTGSGGIMSMEEGSISGRGVIKIGRGGLSTEGQVELLSRSIELQGKIAAEGGISVRTGRGVGEGKKPEFAISGIGSMYGSQIEIIGNEEGVGVKMPKEVMAGPGGLKVVAKGKVEVVEEGVVTSEGGVRIEGEQAIFKGVIRGKGGVEVVAPKVEVYKRGGVIAAGDVSLEGERVDMWGGVVATGYKGDGTLGGGELKLRMKEIHLHENGVVIMGGGGEIGEEGNPAKIVSNSSGIIEVVKGGLKLWTEILQQQLARFSKARETKVKAPYEEAIKEYNSVDAKGRSFTCTGGKVTYYKTVNGEVVKESSAVPKILVMGDLDIMAKEIKNIGGQIYGGNVNLHGAKVVNVGHVLDSETSGKRLVEAHYYVPSKKSSYFSEVHEYALPIERESRVIYPASIEAGEKLLGQGLQDIVNGDVKRVEQLGKSVEVSKAIIDKEGKKEGSIESKLMNLESYENPVLYETMAGGKFYKETRKEFVNPSVVFNSEYFWKKVGEGVEGAGVGVGEYGDGYVTQKLVEEQVHRLTGRHQLEGYESSKEQLEGLMDNALEFMLKSKAKPGQRLEAEEVEGLGKSMVWYEEVEKGGKLWLMPKLYLSGEEASKSVARASTIAGKEVDLEVEGKVNNVGKIVGDEALRVKGAGDINNIKGEITGGEIELESNKRVNNFSGVVKAREELKVKAAEIRNETMVQRHVYEGRGYKDHKAERAVMRGEKGVEMKAEQEINVIGGDVISAGGVVNMESEGDINLLAVYTHETDYVGKSKGEYRSRYGKEGEGSSVEGSEGVRIKAENKIKTEGAKIESKNGVEMDAGEELVLGAMHDERIEVALWKSKGWLGRSKDDYREVREREGKASEVKGEEVLLAGGEVVSEGARVEAEKEIRIQSPYKVLLKALKNMREEIRKEYKKNLAMYEERDYKWRRVTWEDGRYDAPEFDVEAPGVSIQLASEARREWEERMKERSAEMRIEVEEVKTEVIEEERVRSGLTRQFKAFIGVLGTVMSLGIPSWAGMIPMSGEAGAAAVMAADGMTKAAVVQVAVESADKGDIGKGLKSVVSDKGIKKVVSGGLSEVLSGYGSAAFGVGKGIKDGVLGRIGYQVVKKTSDAIVGAVVEGKDIGGELEKVVSKGVVDGIAGAVAGEIGQGYGLGEMSYTEHKMMHALLGAMGAKIKGEDALAGAAGAVVAEVVGEEAYKGGAKDGVAGGAGKLGAAVVGLTIGDVDAAFNAGTIAVENNLLPWIAAMAYMAEQGEGKPLEGLKKIGEGEDVISKAAERAVMKGVELAMEKDPERTQAVLKVLGEVAEFSEAGVKYVDEITGRVVSAKWSELDVSTQQQLRGGGKVLEVLLPGEVFRAIKAIKTHKHGKMVQGAANVPGDFTDSATAIGHKGKELQILGGANTKQVLNGIVYTGHALDRMQSQGIMPSVVENAIRNGQKVDGKKIGTMAYYDKINNLTVIMNKKTHSIITVKYGIIKQ
jgi:adhesin HecA-like repeat protein